MNKNYAISNADAATASDGKIFLKDSLNLTGMEVSVNNLKAGTGSPFVHSHKENEELYLILNGTGKFYVDGNEFPVQAGDAVRVAPEGKRALFAETEINYICIQAKQNSLSQYTMTDGIICEEKTGWM